MTRLLHRRPAAALLGAVAVLALAAATVERVNKGEESVYSSAEVRAELGLDD